jgi:L-alanine-DL-glutamate epimerase-like enolase superfamily enzyme
MELKFTPYRIQCTHPFGIARSTHQYYDVIYVYLSQDGIIGRGEAAPSKRYGEYPDAILKTLSQFPSIPSFVLPEDGDGWFCNQSNGIKALESALSMAWLDWWTQKQNMSLCEYFSADKSKQLATSFTIAIGEESLIPEKIVEAEPYSILKVKLGMSETEDKRSIELIRAETDKLIRVDANEGWDLETGLKMSHWLAEKNIEFIEQPFKADQLENTAILKAESPLPIIADENSMVSDDLEKIAHVFHGINIKLMKCGSLYEAKKMIDLARKLDLEIMLGCMVESSVGITAASHLSPLVDYADLDGNLLINNDPYLGLSIQEGNIQIPAGNGLGLSLVSQDENLS